MCVGEKLRVKWKFALQNEYRKEKRKGKQKQNTIKGMSKLGVCVVCRRGRWLENGRATHSPPCFSFLTIFFSSSPLPCSFSAIFLHLLHHLFLPFIVVESSSQSGQISSSWSASSSLWLFFYQNANFLLLFSYLLVQDISLYLIKALAIISPMVVFERLQLNVLVPCFSQILWISFKVVIRSCFGLYGAYFPHILFKDWQIGSQGFVCGCLSFVGFQFRVSLVNYKTKSPFIVRC